MARKRRTTSRKTGTAAKPRRRTSRKKSKNRLANFVVPLFFIFCLLFCLGFLTFMGYRSATASSFFDLDAVAVRGVARTSRGDIEDIVRRNSIQTGVWNANINRIKREVEELRFVQAASVSRVLPNKVRVIVKERIPKAIARIGKKDYWVDEEARILSRVSSSDNRYAFTMFGWDDSESIDALEENKKRVALFSQLRKEWRKYDLASRVKAIDLSDLRHPRAIVLDSGEPVTIHLGKEDYRNALQRGLENIAGRGKQVESIIMSGAQPVIEYRDS